MNAIDLIIGNLKAMGAAPTTTTDPNGDTLIKVNAPTVPTHEEKEIEK